MTPTIIICATILIIFSMILFVTKLILEDYLSIRRDTYKDMDEKHSERLEKMEGITDWLTKSYNRGEIVSAKITGELSEFIKELASIKDTTTALINTPYATKEELEDIRGRVNSNQIGQVFSPRRKS